MALISGSMSKGGDCDANVEVGRNSEVRFFGEIANNPDAFRLQKV